MKRLAVVLLSIAAACGKPSANPAPAKALPSSAATDVMIRAVPMSGSSSMFEERIDMLSGVRAAKDFVADVKADESGGECLLTRTSGNGALTATGFYPSRAKSNTQVGVTFDSSGRVVRYSEMRGIPHVPTGLPREKLDSARRAAMTGLRSTSISFDYAMDRALAMNRGGGKTASGVTSSVRDMELLDNLGKPAARMERMRKLCGV